ncbi:putative alpha-1D adrenergic receptor-like [Apostichopus japonicus]|uniref:Putative alpha-1D adrenergic receptor-like n=1 Tax=Stichopus japonicus TaxID=307972 RepID=A0A2G8JLT1_STIJA|nr:putative alpha-1D adrenergic receptor-like [Apostichopus japonicus]
MDTNGVEVTILPTDSPGYVFEDPTQRTLLSVIVILVAAVGIPGNILVMIAVTFSKRLQTKTNSFVVNLACSDLATCLILPFQVVALLNDSWPLPDPLCTLVAGVFWVGLGSSVVNLALIAFNRFTLITKSRTRYDHVYSKRNLVLMLVSAWIIPIVLVTVPPLCGLGGIGYAERYKMCSADSTHPLSDVYAFISSVLVEVPCLIIIITCYVKIYRFIRAKNRELFPNNASRGESKGNAQSAAFKRQVKVTKNLFLVVCSYIICIMPFAIACLIPPSYPSIPWVMMFLIANCCVNPIIYGLYHPQFRDVFRRILSCKFRLIPEPSNILQSLTTASTSA